MSEITDFYLSWQGGSAFGNSGFRFRDFIPIVFQPTDISGCAMWLNAGDNDAVVYNNLLQVSSWTNRGYLGDQFDASGAGLIEYGTAPQVNGFNVVSFGSNAFMQGNFQLNFQARSVFFVIREKSVPSGGVPNPWLSSDTTGGMETFSLANGNTTYFLAKHPSPIPELAFDTSQNYLNYPVLVEFINGTDISNNWIGINGTKYPAIFETVASGYNTSNITYYLGGYFGGSPIPSEEDMCEIIVYDRDLLEPERIQVEFYLKTKWALTEPPAPPVPPTPFSPNDIAGLNFWMDANNPSTISLGYSNDVVNWSNLGSVGTVFGPGCNVPTYETDKDNLSWVEFPSATTMNGYMQLPYVDRTAFAVFKNLTPLDTISYPYLNIQNTDVETGRQLGVNYDSNTSNYAMAMCQQGQNCPAAGNLPVVIGTGDTNLAIWGSLSNTSASNTCYWNGGSNINTSTDLGNLYSTNPIPYYFGSPVYDSPSFRIGEVLEYDSLLSSSNISTVANYLVTKWAISSFKNIV